MQPRKLRQFVVSAYLIRRSATRFVPSRRQFKFLPFLVIL
jgi:hypothetical protein